MQTVKLGMCALLSAVLLSTLSSAATQDRIPGALATGQTVTLRGNVHRNAVPMFDRGPADPNLRFGSIMLQTVPTASQQKAINQLLAEQQNRKSPNFHKWITAPQWADRFGLSPSDVSKITAWLKSQGFTGIQVAHARNWISFSGTAAQVKSTFGTEIHRYEVKGEMHVANATSPRLPAALNGVVTHISGLDNFYLKPRAIRRSRPYYTDSTLGNLIAPGDIAKMYDFNSAVDGTGTSIAVIGQTDIYLADLADFRSGFGLPAITCTTDSNNLITDCTDPLFSYQLVTTGVTDPGAPNPGDLSEADLDLEWAAAAAPGATIIYVNAPILTGQNTGGGVTKAWISAIDNNVAPVISLSYGLCEFFNPTSVDGSAGDPQETELQLANSQGITFVNSTGDTGAAGCDVQFPQGGGNGNLAIFGYAVSYPASSPEVTGVGGTAISTDNLSSSTYWGTSNSASGGNILSYVPEIAWNDDTEFGDFCTANPDNTFCTDNSITDAVSAQALVGLSATGGGPSNCATQTGGGSAPCLSGFPVPDYQSSLVVAGTTGVRMTPDVALLSSPNFPGYIFCTQLSELNASGTGSACANGISGALTVTDTSGNPAPSIIGGTSVAAPVFAGMVAMLNQYLSSSGQGNLNNTLYAVAATPSSLAFNQVKTGTNVVSCASGTPGNQPSAQQCPAAVAPATDGVLGYDASQGDATTGYNLVTGLGSVDFTNFATAVVATQLFSMTPTAASYSVAQGQAVDATVNVAFVGSFAGPVTFTCSDTVSESTCTAPAAATTSGQVAFHITTTASSASLQQRPMERGSRIFYAALLPGLMGIVVVAGSRKRSLQGMRVLGLIVVLGASSMWMASCGGSNNSSGGGNGGTPKGNHNITITGASGNVTVSQTLVINVQ